MKDCQCNRVKSISTTNLRSIDQIKEDCQAKDRLAKFFGMFSSTRFHSDWQVIMPNKKDWKILTRKDFVDAMKEYYKSTQNLTLKNLKACVHYFLSNFYFLPNGSPPQTMKNVFYFI